MNSMEVGKFFLVLCLQESQVSFDLPAFAWLAFARPAKVHQKNASRRPQIRRQIRQKRPRFSQYVGSLLRYPITVLNSVFSLFFASRISQEKSPIHHQTHVPRSKPTQTGRKYQLIRLHSDWNTVTCATIPRRSLAEKTLPCSFLQRVFSRHEPSL